MTALFARRQMIRVLVFPLLLLLSACNLPNTTDSVAPSAGITQAYETVAARLTQAANPANPVTTLPTDSGILTTSTPTVQETPAPTTTEPAVTTTPGPTQSCDRAAAANPIDVTIPDDTVMTPGQSFTKIWRFQNVGSCTWTNDYAVVFFSGEQMGAPAAVTLRGEVAPGQFVDVAVDMVAPKEPGSFQGNWKLRNANNVLFGIGPNSSAPFWVRISVVQTQTPTPTSPASTATSTPTVTPPVVEAQGQVTLQLNDRWDADSNLINPETGEEFLFTMDLDGRYTLIPQENTRLGFFADRQPTLDDCRQAELSAEPLLFDTVTSDSFYCYHTNQGLPGWLSVIVLNATDDTLSLAFSTWTLP